MRRRDSNAGLQRLVTERKEGTLGRRELRILNDGFTIAVSENQQLARIAQATVLSDSAFSIVFPVLNQVLNLRTPEIRSILEAAQEPWGPSPR